MPTDLRLFGIRHHGPGSAASLVAALDATRPLLERLEATYAAIRLLPTAGHEADQYAALAAVQRRAASSGLLAGAAARLLFNAQQALAWIEGFLRGSGLVLIHHRELFDSLDTWLGGLAEDTFRAVVPLLRRAFAEFSPPERRQLLDLAAAGPAAPVAAAAASDFDWVRGMRVLPVLRELMGTEEALRT